MPEDPLDFLDSPEVSEFSQTESDPLDFLQERSTNPLRKVGRHVAQAAKGALNLHPAVAAYNLGTTLGREGAHRSRTRVSAQAQKDLQKMDEKLAKGEPLTRLEKRHYDRTKQLAERKNEKAAGIDTESLINRGVKAATGVDLEPEDIGEEITNIGASLISPSKAIKNIQKIPKLFTSGGRAALSAERAAAKTKAGWDALNKVSKGNPEKQGIINWAQQKGLTPREATTLLQTEGKVKSLGKISKPTKKFERDVEGLKQKLGSSYDELRDIGRKGGYLGSQQTLPLLNDLEKIRDEIKLTHVMGPESSAAESALSTAIKDIETNGTTIERLISTRQNLGQGINWKNVGVKEGLKSRMKEAIAQTIEKTNPSVGKQLRETDKYYKKYKSLKDVLDKKKAYININGIPIASENIIFNSVIGAGSLFLHAHPMTAAKTYLVKEGVQRFATALLTRPKLQGIHKQLMQAVLKGDKERQRKLMVVAQKILKKEDPELYSELGLD